MGPYLLFAEVKQKVISYVQGRYAVLALSLSELTLPNQIFPILDCKLFQKEEKIIWSYGVKAKHQEQTWPEQCTKSSVHASLLWKGLPSLLKTCCLPVPPPAIKSPCLPLNCQSWAYRPCHFQVAKALFELLRFWSSWGPTYWPRYQDSAQGTQNAKTH